MRMTTMGRFGLVMVAAAWLAACGGDGGGATSASAGGSGSAKTSATPASSAKATASAAAKPSATASAAPADDGVAITKHFPAVGDKLTHVEVKTAEMKVEVKGPKGEFKEEATENEEEERTEECLAVDGKRCAKLKVTYAKVDKKVTSKDGKVKESKGAHAGKTYVIELKDGAVAVSDEAGKAPAPEELEKVKKDFRNFAKDTDMLEALPDKVKVGDSLDKLAAALGERANDGDDKPTKLEAKVTVKEIREEGGKKLLDLDVTVEVEGKEPKNGANIKLSMKGTVTLRADTGLATKMVWKGPVTATFDENSKGGVTGGAQGQISETTTYTYSF